MTPLAMRPLIFGEVLFDCFPDGSVVLGGAPFNVAWHLHAFGLKPLMISRLGNDPLGEQVQDAMGNWGMDCSGIQQDELHPTGIVEISFTDGEPSYNIKQGAAYDFIDSSLLPPSQGNHLLYHGSLALRSPCSAAALSTIVADYPCHRFVDINLRTPWWQQDSITSMIQGAEWLKLNDDELREIFPELSSQRERIDHISTMVSGQVVLTSGEQGATAITSADGSMHTVKPEAAAAVVDTVGAGDAFCSVYLAGLLLDWPLELTMQRAQSFASAVVGIRGATTSDIAFYQQFTREWNIEEPQDV